VCIDEKNFLSNATPAYGLAPPGVTPTVEVDVELYPLRFDVIDSCTVEEVGPYTVFSPEDREQLGVKGINYKMLVGYFEGELIPFMAERGIPHQVICADRARIHKQAKLSALCSEALGDSFEEFWLLPSHGGKEANPCDKDMHAEVQRHYSNTLLHTDRSPRAIVRAIHHAYDSIPASHAAGWFRRCGLVAQRRRKKQ
jgi:hypothetical protein